MNVAFENDYIRNSKKVFIYEENRNARVFHKADGSQLIIEPGTQKEDIDIVFCLIPNDAMQAFANALSDAGIKTDNDHKIAGTLEATKYHLEDMRKLAKVK